MKEALTLHLELAELSDLSNHVAIALDRISKKREANLGDIEKMSDWFAANLSFAAVDMPNLIIALSVMVKMRIIRNTSRPNQALKGVAMIRCVLIDILHKSDLVRDYNPEILAEMKKFFANYSEAISAELPPINIL